MESSGIDRVSLIARHGGRVIAACSYEGLREPGVAEIALAVADDEQRRGIGTRMLEQLAAIGAERGVRRFDAAVLSANRVMLSVFRNAGFAVKRAVLEELNVSVDITPAEAVVQRIDERDHFAALASLRPILAPSSVAVIAAADTPGNVGRALVENISNGGFGGVVELVDPAGAVVSAGRSCADPGRARGRSRSGHPRGRGGCRSGFRGRGCRQGGESVASCPGRPRAGHRGIILG